MLFDNSSAENINDKIEDFLGSLEQKNIKVWVEGDLLKYKAPKGAITKEILKYLGEKKTDILSYLCKENNKDTDEIEYLSGAEDLKKASIQTIYALNNMNERILDKYLRYYWTLFWIDGNGLNYGAMFKETKDNPFDNTHPVYRFKVDKLVVNENEYSAAAMGYLSGNITYSKDTISEGPWRVLINWVKADAEWKIEHVNISKMNVPKLQYYPQLPKDYFNCPEKKWPLILFLHGIGERGSNLKAVEFMAKRKVGIPYIAAKNKDFPFIAISPMCPWGSEWDEVTYSLNNLLDEVIDKYKVDTNRIYLTGLSMGGSGAWSLAMQYPHRFAAIAPVCGCVHPGFLDSQKVQDIKHIPVWGFHGDKDDIIPIEGHINLIESLKEYGGDAKLTIYHNCDHEIWTQTYDNIELYDWFLKQSK